MYNNKSTDMQYFRNSLYANPFAMPFYQILDFQPIIPKHGVRTLIDSCLIQREKIFKFHNDILRHSEKLN